MIVTIRHTRLETYYILTLYMVLYTHIPLPYCILIYLTVHCTVYKYKCSFPYYVSIYLLMVDILYNNHTPTKIIYKSSFSNEDIPEFSPTNICPFKYQNLTIHYFNIWHLKYNLHNLCHNNPNLKIDVYIL